MLIDLPSLAVLCFIGSHLLFGLPPLRTHLISVLSEQRFVAVFSLTAALSLSLLAWALYASLRQEVPNPWLLMLPGARIGLGIVAWLGLSLALAALPGYPKTPMALFQTRVHTPFGISKISRHSFFVGFAVFALAHSVLMSERAAALMMLGFAVLSLLGASIQDRKLLMRHGEAYRPFMQATSVLPFLAILQGRTRIQAEDRIVATLLKSALAAALITLMHPLWQLANGAALPVLLAIGGFYLSARRWLAARRRDTAGQVHRA
ncbi:hypothetical protein C7S18_15370 [Ahniella affigens]|uniref:NnrU domain-containing protein n=1 Tax=Ahniella affigens TaxID=2021234 RepID=A0A2P1PUI3_9GAMM|nr:NnrU family protein [Ahniella affigens]AVP98480.1 hypothetical protein C7S18_15370 [Ahniella affigens]